MAAAPKPLTPETILLRFFKSQTAIAEAAKISRQAVQNWFVRGSISYAASVVLAAKMGIPAARLQVRWVPRTGRHFNARDGRKMIRQISEAKRASAQGRR